MRSSFKPRSRFDAVPAALVAGALFLTPVSANTGPSDGIGEMDIIVVASPNVPVDNLPMAELRRVFMLERRFWKPGQPATVIYPAPGSAARAWLLRNLLRGDEPGLRRMVLEKMYRGEIDLAPKVVANDQETLAFVASGKGLLALVPASALNGAAVKTLGRNGPHHGGPGESAPE